MRRLIVNADDLGLHAGINAGILKGHSEGIVTSASLSANGAAFEDAIRLLKDVPELAVGVHLTLVGEAPISSAETLPTLAPGGRLPRYFTALFHRLLLRRIEEAEIEREMQAQVALAVDAGIRVSHLDSHQHVHLHPVLLPIVLRVAQRFGIRAVRAARELYPYRGVRPALLFLFARRGAARVRRAGLRTADTCLGLVETGRLDLTALEALLARLPAGTTELVCHPGVGDAAIGGAYDWDFRWDGETAALTSPRVREVLERSQIQLISYRDL